MLFVLITLWTIALFLLISDFRKATTRWLSGVAFCGGSGAMAANLDAHFIPYIFRFPSSKNKTSPYYKPNANLDFICNPALSYRKFK